MNKADEALADVRRWLCDNLSDGDAGKVCGMLSVVSRRIAETDEENAKLRELAKDFLDVPCQCLRCEHYNYEEDRCDLRDRARELGVEVDA